MNNKKQGDQQNYFLTDKALEHSNQDEFDHKSYTTLLEQIIRKQQTPFNIGVFGKWGVGKSSIVNLLRERLEKDIKRKSFHFIEMKVWKYDQNSLKRKFILTIAQQLKIPIDDLYRKIYHDQEFDTALLNVKEIQNTFFRKGFPLYLVSFVFLLFIIIRILNIISFPEQFLGLNLNNIIAKLDQFIVLPLLLAIINWLLDIIKTARYKLKISKYDSEEQFESEFIELIKKDPSTKIVFIDDLDRCSKEKVINTLETIKTFLDVNGCIFIIACDDEIIKDSINRANEIYKTRNNNEGAEYLEKFFQFSIHIPPFMIPDMRQYIKNLLVNEKNSLTQLPDHELEDVIFILINQYVRNPRNAISTINQFSSALLIAKDREKNTRSQMHENVVSSNLRVLAIIISIRIHFNTFYNHLLKNQDLLFWMIDISKNNKNFSKTQLIVLKSFFETDSDNLIFSKPKDLEIQNLLLYLESVREFIDVKDLTPFIFLEIDSTSYSVGNNYLQDLDIALKNGIESKVEQILTNAESTEMEHLFEHINFMIDNKLVGTERRKAIQVLVKNLNICPENKLYNSCITFYRNFQKENIRDGINYDLNGLFICANVLNNHLDNQILTIIINLLIETSEILLESKVIIY